MDKLLFIASFIIIGIFGIRMGFKTLKDNIGIGSLLCILSLVVIIGILLMGGVL